ncbi:predicted protein [Methanosarcina acetivorans C2A]|uniref:Uncharacterized protein n=1 Tax=Methanosarcina acetivorans (strain ATCC 35395 / DSM 2834 / JCM 12185 / C2A) TaxID=188937 RepID=Q8TJG3_METAC|nr:predicted protein [Methanosarcina acetivorans C2A]
MKLSQMVSQMKFGEATTTIKSLIPEITGSSSNTFENHHHTKNSLSLNMIARCTAKIRFPEGLKKPAHGTNWCKFVPGAMMANHSFY